tara:strand:- start:77764 stop:78891 length:1128 start_codon:yes stop_codon:yes gene_type:complete
LPGNTNGSSYLYSLDGLRGVAALSIVFLHYSSYLFSDIGSFVESFTPMLNRTYLFVDMFFILSGFVLSLRYSETFNTTVMSRPYFSFMSKRFFRVYPLHLATLMFLFILHRWLLPFYPDIPPDEFQVRRGNFSLFSNVLLIHSSGIGDRGCFDCTSWNYPSWSISVEWLSYFSIPSLIFILTRLKRLVPVLLLGLMIGLLFIESKVGHLDVASTPGWYRCLVGMIIGVCLNIYAYKRFAISRTIVILWAILMLLGFHYLKNDTLLVVGISIYLLLVVNCSKQGILSSSYFQWLGKRSFSIYLMHVPVQDLTSFFIRLQFNVSPQNLSAFVQVLGFMAAVCATLFLSNFSYRWIELPFIKGVPIKSRDSLKLAVKR